MTTILANSFTEDAAALLAEHGVTGTVRINNRARGIQLKIQQGQWILVLPRAAKLSLIHQFLTNAASWIDKQQKKADTPRIIPAWPDVWEAQSTFPWQGGIGILHLYRGTVKRLNAQWLNKQSLEMHVPGVATDKAVAEGVRRAMIQAALPQVDQWIQIYQDWLGLKPRSVRFRQQTSCWGSLGIHNDISLNWLLTLAPLDVFQYVVLHEMAHLKYRSHGPRFWQLIAKVMPDYDAKRLWLRKFGVQLVPPPSLIREQ